jgi:arylsulfatase
LYDLRRDPGERYDVKELYPEITEALLKQADAVRDDLGDNFTQIQGKNRRPVGRL